MNCPNCHSENKDGAKYCNECGFPLSGRIAEVAAAASGDDVVAAVASGASAAPAEPRGGSLCPDALDASASAQADAPRAAQEPPATAFSVQEGRAPASPEAAAARGGAQAACPTMDGGAAGGAAEAPSAAEEAAGPMAGEPAGRTTDAHVSGPLDPARVPAIAVAGVNVDDDGNPFDFRPLDDGDPAEEGPGRIDAVFPAPSPADLTVPVPRVDPRPASDAGRTADLSGIECLVDPGYEPPAAAWRSGDTMEMEPVEGGGSGRQKQFRAPDPKEKRRRSSRRKTVVALVVVLVLALAAGAAVTYQMEIWGGHTVPNVVGKSQADATYELERKGFAVRWTQVKSDDVEGKVLLTDPSAGSRKEAGTEVVIHVSVARTVPSVVGATKDEAAALFEAEEFANVEYQAVKSDEAEGTVLSVEPAAGEKAKASTHIVVQVATPFTVPDVLGKTQEQAEAALADEAGYVADVRWVYTEDMEEGLVASTDPVAGTKLASGSAVTVNLAKSRAKELVSATHTFFQSSGQFAIDGVTYEVDPDTLDVEYAGDGTTSYSVSARVVETKDYLFFGTQTLYGDWKTVSGTITWNDQNGIASASPSVEKA